MVQNNNIDWDSIKLVIFDVDGTLYDQSRLRKKMMGALLQYYMVRPWRLNEMRILAHFRSEREKKAGAIGPDLENLQYNWCSQKGGYAVPKIKEVVAKWIFDIPNQYLPDCTYPGTQDLFAALRQHGIKIGIYSDYKAHDKLKAMGLAADYIVASTDPEVDRLKPDPQGLLYLVAQAGVNLSECLFIGDRQEMDGDCALKAGMNYLIIDKQPYREFNHYQRLIDQLTQTKSQLV